MARVGKTIVLLSGNMLLYQGEAFLILIISLLVQCHSRKAKTEIRCCRAYVRTHSIEGLAFDIVSSHDLIT
jgi:hypothetical protein